MTNFLITIKIVLKPKYNQAKNQIDDHMKYKSHLINDNKIINLKLKRIIEIAQRWM